MDIRGGGVWYGAAVDGSSCPRVQHLRSAICKVQRQKQRPTAARICRAVRQNVDNVSVDEITAWLNAAVGSGDILLVNNDGVVSYREPRRNVQNLASPPLRGSHPPPVVDIFHQPECAWNFPPQYEPFREFSEFVTQPVNRSFGWPFPQSVAGYDPPYMQFDDRVAEQYNGWLGSFAAVDPHLTFGSDSVVQHRLHQQVPDQSSHQTSVKSQQGACDENRNRQDCSYGVVRSSASYVTEPSLPVASRGVTSDETRCSQPMDVEPADSSGINSLCEERRCADDSGLIPDISELTDVRGLSASSESPDGEVTQLRIAASETEADILRNEAVSNKVSTHVLMLFRGLQRSVDGVGSRHCILICSWVCSMWQIKRAYVSF